MTKTSHETEGAMWMRKEVIFIWLMNANPVVPFPQATCMDLNLHLRTKDLLNIKVKLQPTNLSTAIKCIDVQTSAWQSKVNKHLL